MRFRKELENCVVCNRYIPDSKARLRKRYCSFECRQKANFGTLNVIKNLRKYFLNPIQQALEIGYEECLLTK